MAESVLVNRTRFVSSLKNELVPQLNKLSEETRVPKSRLLDEAIEDLLKKYEKKNGWPWSAVLFCCSEGFYALNPFGQRL